AVDHPDVAIANEEDPAAVGCDLRIDDALAGDVSHVALRPAEELPAHRKQQDVRLLRPDVVGDAGLAQPQTLPTQRFLTRDIRFRDALARRAEPSLRLPRAEVEPPEIPHKVAP